MCCVRPCVSSRPAFVSIGPRSSAAPPSAPAIARKQFETLYPFAVKRFSAYGGQIFATVDIEERPKTATHKIVHGQVIFSSFVRRYFRHHIDIERDFAKRYWPLGRTHRVVLDAKRAFGTPIDAPTGVPTEALVAAVDAGDSAAEVAEWFDVPMKAIEAAIRYERRPLAARDTFSTHTFPVRCRRFSSRSASGLIAFSTDGEGIKDTDFLPQLDTERDVFVTFDKHIRTRPAEAFALQRGGRPGAVFRSMVEKEAAMGQSRVADRALAEGARASAAVARQKVGMGA